MVSALEQAAELRLMKMLGYSGVAFILIGGIIILCSLKQPATYGTAEAKIVRRVLSDATNATEYIVSFEVEGKVFEQRTQPVKNSLFYGHEGERVNITYQRRRALGGYAWRIYIGEETPRAARRTDVLGWLLAIIMLLLGVASLLVSKGIIRIGFL